ncbi:hypothetical protein CF319_g6953 [Tilletia indica]|nr:hypothetical protein CF319_g6953 [Tilletia indica]
MSKRTRAGAPKAAILAHQQESSSPSSSSSTLATTKKKRPNPKSKQEHTFQPVTDPNFTSTYRVTGLHPRAQVFYCEDFVKPDLAREWRERLLSEMEWYRPTLRVYGKDVTQSRQIAAYATTSDLKLTYSGHPVEMHHPFPPLLTQIATHLTQTLQIDFNHVMLNLYEDGSRYIGKHRDNKENLCIASLSLGVGRRWVMDRVRRKGCVVGGGDEGDGVIDRKEWTLADGSLLVMQGDTQELYTHEIPKEPKIKDLRISLTFRQLLNKE